ncbi:MAG: ATP-binding protein, partial [Chloroflexi bacterium]|nr:ATP-binding protein [Chloroflexota bacterium]
YTRIAGRDRSPVEMLLSRIRRLLPRSVRGTMILLVLVVLVPILLAQAGLYWRRFEVRRAQEFQANLEVARSAGVAVEGYVRDVTRVERALAMSITIENLPVDQIPHYLAAAAGMYLAVGEFDWLDTRGRIVASSNARAIGLDAQESDYFQEIAQGRQTAVSNLFPAPDGGMPVFAIAQAVRSAEGSWQGVIVALVDAQRLGVLEIPIERGGDAAVAIIDERGFLVYRSPEVERSWEQRNLLPTQPLIRKALAGEEVTGTFVSSMDGRERMAGFVPIRSIGWVASASIPVSRAMAPVMQDLLAEIGTLLFIATLAFLVAMRLSHSITAPIEYLQKRALGLAHQEPTPSAKAAGPIELERLAEAFSEMSEEIQTREQRIRQINEQLAVSTIRSREHAEETERRAEDLRKLQEQREDMIRAVSHDLRNPLSIIMGHAQIIVRLGETVAVRKSAEAVITGAQRMNAIIQDMVDSVRFETGQLKLEKAPVDVRCFVAELLERAGAMMEAGRVRVEIPGDLPLIPADPNRLERILMNLLSNALKYAPPETEVLVKAQRLDYEIMVSVSDRGIGIAPEDISHIFERFYEPRAGRKAGGVGLGLYISRMFVEAHGGRIWVESAVGKGSTFRFTLPIS